MRIAMAVTSFLALAIVAIALGVGSMGASAVTNDDDEYPPQDPQCGDQEGDDEDPWDVGPEDTATPEAETSLEDVSIQGEQPTPSWDGDHDIEWDDCYYTTLAPETTTPTATPSPTPTQEPQAFTNGDANCDGNLNGTDAVTILLDISGSGSGGDCGSADADCSGSVDTADVSRVLGIVAGLDDSC